MSVPEDSGARNRHGQLALAVVMVLQSVAVVFFMADAAADLLTEPLGSHSIVEALVTLALVAGVLLTGWQLRQTLERIRVQERTIETARGDLSRVIADQFSAWKLTPAERDVGLLALKGLDPAEIAEIRGAAPSTVRAQLTRIYSKAGVAGRAQFAAWFVEDLLDNGVSHR